MSEYVIDPARYASINLQKGSHVAASVGMCMLEATAYLVGEQHSDRPRCVSQALGAFGRGLNDALPDDLRQELKGLIPSLPGTFDDGFDEARSFMSLDWLIRVWFPAWLDLSPNGSEGARNIRALDRIMNEMSAESAGPAVRSAYDDGGYGRANWGLEDVDAHEYASHSCFGASSTTAALLDCGHVTRLATSGREIGWAAVRIIGDADKGAVESTVRELQLSAVELFVEIIKNPR